MRVRLVLGVIGFFLRMFALAFIPPFVMALANMVQGHPESGAVPGFATALAVTAGIGWLFSRGFERSPLLRRGEALGVVAGTWLLVAACGSIPYLFYHLSLTDAFFESMSGLTTTGATILTDFARHDRPFYLWRAMTQWFGGLGVIALFVVILPRLGIAGRQIFFAEASSASGDGVSPQVRDSARRLWILYTGLTLLEVVLLRVTGMTLYDAVVHSMTTMSAGGFSPHPRSIEGYSNAGAEWVFIVFMVLSGTSFTLQYRAFTKKPLDLVRDAEFRTYFLGMLFLTLLAAALLSEGMPSLESVRTGAFQISSLASSTGYASVDFEGWSQALKTVLILAMVMGGCAGSACGGAKVIRYLITTKVLRRELKQVLHPTAVLPIRYKGVSMPPAVLRAVTTLVVLYIVGYGITGALLVLVEPHIDILTGFSASLACLGNIGPGFGPVGPMGTYADLSTFSKVLLTAAMWVGRLEIVTVVALLHPDVWRNMQWRSHRPAQVDATTGRAR